MVFLMITHSAGGAVGAAGMGDVAGAAGGAAIGSMAGRAMGGVQLSTYHRTLFFLFTH